MMATKGITRYCIWFTDIAIQKPVLSCETKYIMNYNNNNNNNNNIDMIL